MKTIASLYPFNRRTSRHMRLLCRHIVCFRAYLVTSRRKACPLPALRRVLYHFFTMGSAERRARDIDPSQNVQVQDPLSERRACSGVSSSTHVLTLKRNSKKPSSATYSESHLEEQGSTSQPSECENLSETASPAVPCMKQSDSLADLRAPLSPKAKVGRFTCEVLLVARLAITLWSYLGLGTVLL